MRSIYVTGQEGQIGEYDEKKLFTQGVLFFIAVLFLMTISAFAEAGLSEESVQDYTDLVVLTTTDMHGKCWDINVLTDGKMNSNMLRVSTAVKQIREEYGAENVLLLDNGDLFQGTPVSQIQLLDYTAGESGDPLAMALCLKEIGYDAFVLGNHEFNFNWDTMSAAYRYLEENGVPVLSANSVYDGSDGVHEAGENAFTPYIVKTISVGGNEHKIGILALENTDITKWDLQINYPGLMFSHPGNENHSISYEAGLYIPQMKAEGCEFIIVSYHGGLGSTDRELVFGDNSANQGLRLIQETEDIDLLITGHDHSSAYSNQYYENRAGRPVLTVNGGGQDLTKSVFRFSEDKSGALTWEITGSENLKLGSYDTDKALEAEMAPYAERAVAEVETSVGNVEGDWDGSDDYFLRQTDTVDLVNDAMMTIGTKRLEALYGDGSAGASDTSDTSVTSGTLDISGLDHLDVDMSATNPVSRDGYVIKPGGIPVKDIYKLYQYDNSILVLPLSGRQIRSVMEENAANRLKVRVLDGKVFIYTQGDNYTNIVFGGVNFAYDLSKPVGERVQIEGFSNGRAFDEDAVYLVAVSNYILGNQGCGLRDCSEDDAVWSQLEEGGGESVQDLIAEYIRDRCAADGALTPETFNWKWSLGYSADPESLAPYDGETAASFVHTPEDGHTYILYQESEGLTLTGRTTNGGLGGAACEAYGNSLPAPLPEDTLRFTVHITDENKMTFTDPQGRFLTCGENSGLSLTDDMADNDLSLWTLREANGGWYIVSAGTGTNPDAQQALEFHADSITTYRFGKTGQYIFNFYEPEAE